MQGRKLQRRKLLINRTFWVRQLFKGDYYMQSPIIKNGLIRNDPEILGKFKEQRLSRSKLRNA